jgi:GNAT superfamily N-acetyltransferase
MTIAESIRIVPVGPERAGEVAQVWRASFRRAYPDFPPMHGLESHTNFIGSTLMKRTRVEAAMEGDLMVGIIAFSDQEVAQLYILPGWQGQGIGTRLLQRALARADRLTLATFQVNAEARAFYARHGFTETAWSDGDNQEGQPDVQMQWCRQ